MSCVARREVLPEDRVHHDRREPAVRLRASCAGSHSTASARSTATGNRAAISSAARSVVEARVLPGPDVREQRERGVVARRVDRVTIAAAPDRDHRAGFERRARRRPEVDEAHRRGRVAPAVPVLLVPVAVEPQVQRRARADLEQAQRQAGAAARRRRARPRAMPTARPRSSAAAGGACRAHLRPRRRAGRGTSGHAASASPSPPVVGKCGRERGRRARQHHAVHTAEQRGSGRRRRTPRWRTARAPSHTGPPASTSSAITLEQRRRRTASPCARQPTACSRRFSATRLRAASFARAPRRRNARPLLDRARPRPRRRARSRSRASRRRCRRARAAARPTPRATARAVVASIEPLLDDRGATLAAHVAHRPDVLLVRVPLRFVQHVHLGRDDDESFGA